MSEWWRNLYEVSLHSHPHDLARGMAACEQLLSVPGLPWSIEEATRRNATWYCQQLSAHGTVTTIDFPHREGWSLFNPSIATNDKGDICAIVRSSNYRIDETGRYVMPEEDAGVIKTENYFLDLVRGEDIQKYRVHPGGEPDFLWDDPALMSVPGMPTNDFPVQGIEDCRLFSAHGEWKYTGTVRNLNPSGVCQQIRVNLATDWWQVLTPPREHNKNWMPVVSPWGGPMLIDRCYPLIFRDLSSRFPLMRDSPYISRSFRGGAAVLVDMGTEDDIYLAVVHESITMEPYEKIYTHRFVEIDAVSTEITRISDPFVFEKRGIEFAAGLCQIGDDLVISYGVDDAEAHLLRIPLTTALSMLRWPYPETMEE